MTAPEPLIVRRFDPAPGPLDNPLKGWCTYTDAGPIHQPYSMVFRYVSWRELEPREGDFRFAEWEERAWNDAPARGKHVVLRVYIDYPSLPSGLPAWLRDRGVTVTGYTDHGGGESPDYKHPLLITALERLITALGSRYDTHPRVAFLQLGLLGFWGEWHTWPRGELFATEDIQKRVVDAYHRAFRRKKLMARYATGHPGKQPWLGYHDDYFPEDTGDEKDWYLLYGMRRSGRLENWRVAPIGGEMIPQKGIDALKWVGTDEGWERTKSMIKAAHFSWVGPYSPALVKPPTPEFAARCQEMVRRMGYELRLSELRHAPTVRRGKALTFLLQGENQGVAPFYYPWPVRVALLNDANRVVDEAPLAKADLQKWQPGPFTLRDTLLFRTAPPGRYRLALGIVDPWTNRPAIGFANHLPRQNGWTILSNLTVLS